MEFASHLNWGKQRWSISTHKNATVRKEWRNVSGVSISKFKVIIGFCQKPDNSVEYSNKWCDKWNQTISWRQSQICHNLRGFSNRARFQWHFRTYRAFLAVPEHSRNMQRRLSECSGKAYHLTCVTSLTGNSVYRFEALPQCSASCCEWGES